jgi:glycosyltransferase involved in cell wall biosynthesis
MTGRLRLGEPAEPEPGAPGVRVVLDLRPLQDPGRTPLTAVYLEELIAAFDAEPVAGESFALLLRSDLDDPTGALRSLEVVGRRLLPPSRRLGPATLAVDPFLLRGASVGAAWRAERGGAAGAVYHAAAGAIPLASRIPVVVTLLDLAPWELPDAFRRGPLTSFGQRLRTRLIHDSAALIVGTGVVADRAARLLRVRRDRFRVVRLAPRPAFAAAGAGLPPPGRDPHDPALDHRAERERLGLPERYFVYPGRYDARQDLGTLLAAIAALAADGRPAGLSEAVPWPPRVLLVGAGPDDRASLARAAGREGVAETLAYAPNLDVDRLAALVRGARGVLLPVVSEAAGLAAIEALACGTPVVASAVGALPELVGGAGILVEPRDPVRLATALRAAWANEGVHERLASEARYRAARDRRTWADVARETRRVYAEAAAPGPLV